MDRNMIRQVLGYMIGLMPTNLLRNFLYRTFFGYRIRRSSIGWGTVLVVDTAELDACSIGRNNKFIGPMRITIGKGSRIGDGNRFDCGWWTLEEVPCSGRMAAAWKIVISGSVSVAISAAPSGSPRVLP